MEAGGALPNYWRLGGILESGGALPKDDVPWTLPTEIENLVRENLASCPRDISSQLAAEILEGSGNLPGDSQFLLGRPAALFAGGDIGIDAAFAKKAAPASHHVMHWLGPSARASKHAQELNDGGSICRLDASALDHPKVTAALDRCARIRCGASDFNSLCQENPAYLARAESLRRCFFLVSRAFAVYVVAPRPAKADDPGQPPMDIGGDAGWAAQMYIDRFSPVGEEENSSLRLFLFDDAEEDNPEHINSKTTARRWTFWQAPTSRNGLSDGKWTEFGQPQPVLHQTAASAWKAKESPPPPCGFYACLGTRLLNWSHTQHAEALDQVYDAPPEEGSKGTGKGRGAGKGKGKRRGSGEMGQDSAIPDMDL